MQLFKLVTPIITIVIILSVTFILLSVIDKESYTTSWLYIIITLNVLFAVIATILIAISGYKNDKELPKI